MKRSDSQIKQSVVQELKWDTRVDETGIGVAVVDGVVTLTGDVSNWGIRTAAQEAAHRVTGVLDVANDIKVKLPGGLGRTDADIAQAVRHALEWDVFVPEARIRSTVSEGCVTLEGDVDYWSQRINAESAVNHLAGVRGVIDRIEIKAPNIAAHDVRKSIEDALARRAEREAAHIGLDIKDGRVSLTGIVHTLVERAAVLGAVRGTPGVQHVEDHLRVEPFAQ